MTFVREIKAANHRHQQAHIVLSFVFVYKLYIVLIRHTFNLLYLIFCAHLCLLSLFVPQRAVLACAMEMVGALWVTMAGTVCASWAGGAPPVTPLWKQPAVMSRTTMEVKSQTTHANVF